MISICCVGFASLDVVCDELNDGILVYSRFLINVCMFIVSIALLISSATVIVRARGAICLNPFGTMLFTVCSTRAPIYRAMKAFCIHTRTHSKPADLWCRDGLKEAHFWIRLLSIHMWNNILYGIMF